MLAEFSHTIGKGTESAAHMISGTKHDPDSSEGEKRARAIAQEHVSAAASKGCSGILHPDTNRFNQVTVEPGSKKDFYRYPLGGAGMG